MIIFMTQDAQKFKPKKFTWVDVVRSIWYFLDEDKKRWVFFNSILFSVFFYNLVPPYIVGNIVDFFTNYQQSQSLNTFYYYVIFLGVSSAFISLIRLGSKNALTKIGINARTRARVLGFEKLVNLPLHWHAHENTGNKIQRIFTGSGALREWSHLTNNTIFPVVVVFISVIGAFLFLSPIFSVFFLVYLALFFFVQTRFNKKISLLSNQINLLNQAASGIFTEGSSNLLSIKAMGVERGINIKVGEAEEALKQLALQRTNIGTYKWYLYQTLNGLAHIVFFLLVGDQVLKGSMTIGQILVFYMYFNKMSGAANDTDGMLDRMIDLKSDLANMMPIFLEETAVKTGNQKFPKNWDKIEIINGSFKYPSGQEVFKDITFHIKRNEKLGIAGESGSSKSTLVKILLGLYQLEGGQFKVGDKNYYDIAHDDLIKNIAVVLQETELFNLSLKENITGMKVVNNEFLRRAVDISGLKDVIDKLPDGVDTLVGEKGYKLSGGERQRLGIARAICKNAPIIILDEATSSLDSKTEKKIMDKLLSKFGDEKTFIIIAHRISTLKDTDRVAVFVEGNIVEEGIYQDLIQDTKSHLGQLYALQSGTE